MDKKLLLCVSTMMACAQLFAQSFTAQWPRPSLTPNFSYWNDEGEFYLWNIGGHGFLALTETEWAYPYSQLPVELNDTAASKIRFTREDASTYETTEHLQEMDVWLLSVYLEPNKRGNTGWMHCFVPQGSYQLEAKNVYYIGEDYNRYFRVTRDDLYFTFALDSAMNSSSEQAGNNIGVAATDGTIPRIVCHGLNYLSSNEKFYDQWALVDAESYENYRSYITSPSVRIVSDKYKAAQELKSMILWAEDQGVATSSLAQEYAVYNNLSSTLEELVAATQSARDKGRYMQIAPVFDGIVQGEKNYVTEAVENPRFDYGADGWDISWTAETREATHCGFQGAYYHNAETDAYLDGFMEVWKESSNPPYIGDGSISQRIPSLPAGIYTLELDAISINQYKNASQDVDDVELFSLSSDNGLVYTLPLSTPVSYPAHQSFHFAHDGGNLTIGFRVKGSAEAAHPANWVAMDNLELYYYGAAEGTPAKAVLDKYVEDALAECPLTKLDRILAYRLAKENYRQSIVNAQIATDNYDASRQQMKASLAALMQSAACYERYMDAIDHAFDWFETHSGFMGHEMEILEQYLTGEAIAPNADMPHGNLRYIVPNYETRSGEGTLPDADILAEIDFLQDLMNNALRSELADGFDLTELIKNPDFEIAHGEQGDGWLLDTSNGGTGSLTNWHGGSSDNYCAEAYEQNFDVYQTIEGVKPGLYEVSVQAFYRSGPNADAYAAYLSDPEMKSEAKVYTEVYFNDFATPVRNLMEILFHENLAGNCTYLGLDKDSLEIYCLNGMASASEAFSMPADSLNFTMKVYGIVKPDGNSDTGSIRLGIRRLKTPPSNAFTWSLWDHFKLTYRAKNEEVLATAIENCLKRAADLATDNMGVNEAAALASAAAIARNVTGGEAMFEALSNLITAVSNAEQSITAYEQLISLCDQLDEAVLNADTQAPHFNTSAYEHAIALQGQASTALDAKTESPAEVNALNEEIEETVAFLRLPTTEGASEQNPADMTVAIVNNSFETGDFTGWTFSATPTGDTRIANNSAQLYHVDNADGNYVFNIWNSGSMPEGYWLQQTIKYLPAGQYRLTALLASDVQNEITLAANDEVQIFSMTHDKSIADTCSVVFGLPESTPLVIRVASDTWFKADNFRLEYLGAYSGSVNIQFADAEVKRVCVARWDTDGDGELSLREAEEVTELGEAFYNNTRIRSFDELQYFTGLSSIGNRAFYHCANLGNITFPETVAAIGQYAFWGCVGLDTLAFPQTLRSIGDYAFQNCTALSHFRLPQATERIGRGAFLNCAAIRHLVIPENVSEVGIDAFLGTTNLLAVEWNSPARVSGDTFMAPSDYGNLLFYVNYTGQKPDIRYHGNVILNGEIPSLTLIETKPLFVPTAFRAGKVQLSHNFTKQTFIGEASGWEGIVLPFDVQTVEHETKGQLAPFGTADWHGAWFWLATWRETERDGQPSAAFASATSMQANTPYVLAMPNNERYQEPYNVSGRITFSATNAVIEPTSQLATHFVTSSQGRTFCGTYTTVAQSPSVYTINEDIYSDDGIDYHPGAVFLPNRRSIQPFEAYILIDNGQQTTDHGARPRYIPIFPSADADSELANAIPLISPLPSEGSGEASVYDLSGRRVAANPADLRRQSALKPGIYLYRNQKILIK